MAEEQGERKLLPIEWIVPEDIVGRYATNIVIQHSEHEFIISFFEVWPPIVLGTPEETEAQLEKIEAVRAECVARLIVSAERLPVFIKVLQDNLETYRSKLGEG